MNEKLSSFLMLVAVIGIMSLLGFGILKYIGREAVLGKQYSEDADLILEASFIDDLKPEVKTINKTFSRIEPIGIFNSGEFFHAVANDLTTCRISAAQFSMFQPGETLNCYWEGEHQ